MKKMLVVLYFLIDFYQIFYIPFLNDYGRALIKLKKREFVS